LRAFMMMYSNRNTVNNDSVLILTSHAK